MSLVLVILAVVAILALAPIVFLWGILALATHYGSQEDELRAHQYDETALRLANKARRQL